MSDIFEGSEWSISSSLILRLVQTMTLTLSSERFVATATTLISVFATLAKAVDICNLLVKSNSLEYVSGFFCWILLSNMVIVLKARIFLGIPSGGLLAFLATETVPPEVSLGEMPQLLQDGIPKIADFGLWMMCLMDGQLRTRDRVAYKPCITAAARDHASQFTWVVWHC